MRCLEFIAVSTVALLFPVVLRGDEPDQAPPPQRGVVVQVGKDEDGRDRVNVEVDKAGIKVDVNRDDTGKPHVKLNFKGLDLNLDRLLGKKNADEPGDKAANETTVDLGAPDGAEDAPVVAPKPAASPARETYLGLFTRNLPDELAAQLSVALGENKGLLVLEVVPDSPAAKSGLKKHDVLLRYDDRSLAKVQTLKDLIAADKPGRTVKLAILRGGSPQTVEVVLDERAIARPRGDKETRVDEAIRRTKETLTDEKREVRIISKQLIQVPGVTIQLGGAEVPEATPPKNLAGKKILITTENGKQFKVDVKYISADGTAVEQEFEGTPAELDEKLKELPEQIRSEIRRTLEGFDAEKAQSLAFRFNVEPRVEGDRRVLRISMRRPGDSGETRILEIEEWFDGRESIQLADVMKIDVVASELKNLGSAIREKLEATLNRVQIPEIRVGVEKSQ